MRIIPIAALTLLTVLVTRSSDAQTLYTCGMGTVRGVHTIVEVVSLAPVVSTFDTWGEPQEHVVMPPHDARPAHVVTVQLFNFEYTGEAFADDAENFDPTQLMESDRISICINHQQMILSRDNGAEFRATIIRRKGSKQRPTGTK
jgi:hypothetical protein